MCGVCGEVSFAGPGPEQHAVEMMSDTMAERGPDGSGVWSSDHVVLANRRLAVMDPERGDQPMSVETSIGSVALSYAGEVYNHLELRRDLEARGHEFRTNSDTEVVLNGYMEWGEDVAEKLRGMFGFAVWDGRGGEEKLHLIRDPLGVKPINYHLTPNGAIFGSELKTVLAHPNLSPKLGLPELREFFTHAHSPGHTYADGIQEVKPGTVVTIEPNRTRERTFWHLSDQDHCDDPDATVEHVRDLLEEIVAEQTVADVPFGTLLSGGIDSSTITALASRIAVPNGKVPSYEVDFEGVDELPAAGSLLQSDRDAPFAQEVASMWNTDHKRFVMNSLALAARELRERIVRARGLMPGSGDSHASRLLMFEGIRERSKVVLSGEMADELFGGYRIFFDDRVLGGNGWPWVLYNPQADAARMEAINPEIRSDLDLEVYRADTYAAAVSQIEPVDGETPTQHRQRQINHLEITRHAGILLDFTDRLSSAVGLEVRVPYCDHRLVDYVYNVPWDIKAPADLPENDRTKRLLKDVARNLLPQSVLERSKSPYPMTPHVEYIEEIQRQVGELVAQPSNPVFYVYSRQWLKEAAQKPTAELTYVDRSVMNDALDLDVWDGEIRV